jgi:NAD+ synthase (glutamine-hydrolysing)
MPNYGMFHDKRHFTSLRQLAHELDVELPDILRAFELPINGVQTNVGVIICEDMWDADYVDKPIDILREQGVAHMVNLSSSPFGIDKARVRDAYLARQSRDFKQFWYSNNVGRGGNGKNEHVFDGSSLLFENGAKVMQAPTFQEGIFDGEAGISEAPSKGKEIHDAQVYAIRERWASIGKPKVVIGLSGGIDSAISAALFVQAIGAENVIGVNMPTEFNGATLK